MNRFLIKGIICGACSVVGFFAEWSLLVLLTNNYIAYVDQVSRGFGPPWGVVFFSFWETAPRMALALAGGFVLGRYSQYASRFVLFFCLGEFMVFHSLFLGDIHPWAVFGFFPAVVMLLWDMMIFPVGLIGAFSLNSGAITLKAKRFQISLADAIFGTLVIGVSCISVSISPVIGVPLVLNVASSFIAYVLFRNQNREKMDR